MKTLLVLRHAKSSWKNPELSDHDRPLNKRGERDAPRMGYLLRELDLVPELVLSSTARRAQRTALLAAQEAGVEQDVRLLSELYFSGSEAYLQVLSELPDEFERVMVVGHNPDLEELVDHLTGEGVRLPTAALAQIRLPIAVWQELDDEAAGDLVSVWRPKELASP